MNPSYFIVGGAGFIGSHFVDHLLAGGEQPAVTIFDNLSSGRAWHYENHANSAQFRAVCGNAGDLAALTRAMRGHTTVIHLAANPDTARAATESDIDFREGTCLTNNVLEAIRRCGIERLLYASSSCVYGDMAAETEALEECEPLRPISTYGASKIAGEALITAYCHMFHLTARAFRFGNVVGPRQTHGVCLDFLRRLLSDSTHLRILGDGAQSKSYVDVHDVVRAVLLAEHQATDCFCAYNVATGDYITVTEIAHLAIECLGLDPGSVELQYAGGKRGWKGDVPVVRLSTERIRALGWQPESCTREALRRSMLAMIPDLRAGRL